MIQALSSNTPQKAFTDGIGARGVIGRCEQLDVTRCYHSSETGAKLAIMIANEVLRRVSIGSGLPQLLCGPSVGGGLGHADVDYFPRSQFDDEEGKHRAKEQVSHLEEVAGSDLSCMIMQKRLPALPRWARRMHAPHVLLDRPFADVNIQLQ